MPVIKMEQCTLQQYIEMLKIHYRNGENLVETGENEAGGTSHM